MEKLMWPFDYKKLEPGCYLNEGLTFGQAIERIKCGYKVARKGWNGKNMWLCLMPALTVPAGMVNERTRKFVPEGDLQSQPYIVMWTAQGTWQPGWLASQTDILAEDWFVVL
jgi:hypothetical protein